MDGKELARLIGPLLTMNGRPHLRALAKGATSDVVLRYDHVRDWSKLSEIIKHPELDFFDGEEWFIIEIMALAG